ncbi:MAG: hypothetical protein H6567_00650 [Lewinellaceae bacterium]|nr:hypothetical protein [Lewinellaceae bacterium]
MNICWKYIISVPLVWWLTTGVISAQRNYNLGIDLTKTIVNHFPTGGSGVVIEPLYLYSKNDSKIKFKIPFGYSQVKMENVFFNSKIKTTGAYIKPGIGYSSSKNVVPYLNLLFTIYTINNTYKLDGPVFGDYIDEYRHSNLFAFGIEPNIDYRFTLIKNLALITNIKLSMIFYNSESKDFPVHYIAGAGIVRSSKVIRSATRRFISGVNIYLVF